MITQVEPVVRITVGLIDWVLYVAVGVATAWLAQEVAEAHRETRIWLEARPIRERLEHPDE